MMNKRADISITILVLGIVALCFLTIFSFITSERGDEGSIIGIGLIETMNSISVEQEFYQNTEFNGVYGNLYEKGNVIVRINGDKLNGEYFANKQNFIRSCDDKNWKLFEKCKKIIVSIEYNE
jgi:hypothetical protein